MKKIPTVFVRDPETNLRYVKNEINPAAQWVIDGEGVPTRKYDGTCVMFDGDKWWARREVKKGKSRPEGFRVVQLDLNTGKTVGWEPIEQSSFHKYWLEAINGETVSWEPGTMELVGPKINRNPEETSTHLLFSHEYAQELGSVPLHFEGLREYLTDFPYEGIVWHHPDGRMAKLKAKDFPR